MPQFRFETAYSGQITISQEELASPDLASPRAIEMARAALDAGATDQSGLIIKVYDEAGYLVATTDVSDLRLGHFQQEQIGDPRSEEPGVMRSG